MNQFTISIDVVRWKIPRSAPQTANIWQKSVWTVDIDWSIDIIQSSNRTFWTLITLQLENKGASLQADQDGFILFPVLQNVWHHDSFFSTQASDSWIWNSIKSKRIIKMLPYKISILIGNGCNNKKTGMTTYSECYRSAGYKLSREGTPGCGQLWHGCGT